jgi:O-succinylbenzoate synthase
MDNRNQGARMPLDRLVIYHVPTSLNHPYRLSFGVVDHFDSFIALASFADGSCRVGESTPPPGYSPETAELLAREYGMLARHGLLKSFLDRNQAHPFVTAPLLTCLDPTLAKTIDGSVYLCPILQWNQLSEIAENLAALAAQGNKVVKVKITPNMEEARIILRETIKAGEEFGLRFRYDANGALDETTAKTLVGWMDDASTELLEQPFPPDAWLKMASLYACCPISLMLDESIRDGSDVYLAAGCADYIKLKLAKNGSPSRLLELIRQAREIGLKVILGNGVQGMVGCWLEGQVQVLAGLENLGEMNGYRKIRDNFLGSLFESTSNGFSTRCATSWVDMERLLKYHSIREYQIPIVSVAASCA